MPYLRVCSGPLPVEAASLTDGLRADLVRETGIASEHFVVLWQLAQPAPGGPQLVVDVVVPDLHPPERVGVLLEAAARSLGAQLDLEPEAIFAVASFAHSGMVHHAGLQTW